MAKQSIQEYLGVPKSWPIREKLRHEIVLMPSKADIRNSDRRDPLACALHNTACRVYGIPNCAIGGRWAYIPQRDEDGKYYIARMQATAHTQRAIRAYDRTGTMPEGGFRFIPLAESHFYANKKKYMRKWSRDDFKPTRKMPASHAVRHRIKTRTIPMNVKLTPEA